MKKYLAFIVCAIFLISSSGPLWAVEKKDKKKTEEKEQLKDKEPAKKKVTEKEVQKKDAPKKYDTFIDANNNGIDDRKENLKKKTTEKKAEVEKDEKK